MVVQFILSILIFYSQAFAGGQVLLDKPTVVRLLNNDCEKSQSCDLLSLRLHSFYYKNIYSDNMNSSYGKTIFMGYETSSQKSLEEYALVQFIKGCNFESSQLKNGQIDKKIRSVRELFGKNKVPARFPEWIIDSIDEDPMYNNSPNDSFERSGTRHGPYRSNLSQWSFNEKTESYFYNNRNPRFSILYVSDRPDNVSVNDSGLGINAENHSFQFKVCVYKTKDIPLKTTYDNIHFSDPIICANWDLSYIYNFDTNKYEHKNFIDPFCLQY